MISTQYIKLNMTPSGVLPVLYCSQYDVGRPLGLVVYNGSEPVDLSTYTVTIEGTRTDGTPITAAVTTDGNIGAFATTATMTNKADCYHAKMVIADSSGNRVASLAFVMMVTPKTMDENAESIEEDKSLYQQYTGTVQTLIADIRTELTDLKNQLTAETARAESAESSLQSAISAEALARQAADQTLTQNLAAEASARQTADISLQSAIAAEAAARASEDAVLSARMDTFASLPDGSTAGDAELLDIRVGADGVTYPSAGDAVRANDSQLKSHLSNLADFTVPVNAEINVGTMVVGQYVKTSDGTNGEVPYGCRTNYISVNAPVLLNADFDRGIYKYTVWGYSGSSVASAVKRFNAEDYSVENKLFIDPGETIKYIRIGILRIDRQGAITAEDAAIIKEGISFTKTTDDTITQFGVPADAGATGEAITTQGSELIGQMYQIANMISSLNGNALDGWVTGKNLSTNGTLIDSSDFSACATFIKLPEYTDYVSFITSEYVGYIATYSSPNEKDFLTRYTNTAQYSRTISTKTAKYVRISVKSTTQSDYGTVSLKWDYPLNDKINTALCLDGRPTEVTVIPDGTDYDTLTTPGNYVCRNSASNDSMIHRPNTSYGHVLYVFNITATSRILQVAIQASGTGVIFKRVCVSDSWSEWDSLGLPYSVANATSDGLRMLSSGSKITGIQFKPIKDISEEIKEDITYKGIPYQNRFGEAQDALFNFSLDAVYSMFKNPESLMYTSEIYNSDDEREAFTGAVCSSVVSWITGQPIIYTTYDIRKMLDFKTIYDLADLEIGDIAICHTLWSDRSDHAAVITNIYSDADGITEIEMVEAWHPTSRSIKLTASQFWGLMDGTTRIGDKYRIGRFPSTKIRTVSPVKVNTDIISERGDNIWYEYGDDVFIQSLQDTFTIASPSESESVVDFATLPVKSGGTLRNIGALLDEVGRWTLYGSNGEESHITIIKTGTASLNNGEITLSGYEGCTPVGFCVVGVYPGTGGRYPTYMEGDVTAQRMTIYDKDDYRYAGKIENDTFELDLSSISDIYVAIYVRIFYDTGCGQAWKDTNLQAVN